MDPDQTLADLRALVQVYLDGREPNYEQVCEKFIALDEWLSAKGFPPRDWSTVHEYKNVTPVSITEGEPLENTRLQIRLEASDIQVGDEIDFSKAGLPARRVASIVPVRAGKLNFLDAKRALILQTWTDTEVNVNRLSSESVS